VISPAGLAAVIDHTLLRPEATLADIERLCREAVQHRFACVCVNPGWVKECHRLLAPDRMAVASVVDFPLGAGTPEMKTFAAREAIADGAAELDVVMDIGALKSGDSARVEHGLRGVREAAGPGVLLKVILETGLLTREEKVAAARMAVACGAEFVKTSTGFGAGATVDDVRLLRETLGPGVGIKASGGIRTLESALAMLDAGATRIGTSSGVAILAALHSGSVPG
jgi:deoxyribose-phosphate aldolase